ncbi:hypothetical protein [Nocardioides sp.]|uniref:hypothetical protein n=1 Tax=Nocardioides sp. TaxID=35761 RepID=UPI002CD4CF8D|nr:hypothetical protein [Nocardioides sp.]HSX68135.1 hypothetical protein [Nocardioides sp.]
MGFRSPLNGIPPSSLTDDMIADGAITGPKLSADAIDGKTITGAFIRTAAAGKRWELDSNPANELRAYSGHPDEVASGGLTIETIGDDSVLTLETPSVTGAGVARLKMVAADVVGVAESDMYLTAREVTVGTSSGAGGGFNVYDTALVNRRFSVATETGSDGIRINDSDLVRGIKRGTATVSLVAAPAASFDVAVTSPTGSPPAVVLCTVADSTVYFATTTVQSATTIRIWVRRWDGTSATVGVAVDWLAIY